MNKIGNDPTAYAFLSTIQGLIGQLREKREQIQSLSSEIEELEYRKGTILRALMLCGCVEILSSFGADDE